MKKFIPSQFIGLQFVTAFASLKLHRCIINLKVVTFFAFLFFSANIFAQETKTDDNITIEKEASEGLKSTTEKSQYPCYLEGNEETWNSPDEYDEGDWDEGTDETPNISFTDWGAIGLDGNGGSAGWVCYDVNPNASEVSFYTWIEAIETNWLGNAKLTLYVREISSWDWIEAGSTTTTDGATGVRITIHEDGVSDYVQDDGRFEAILHAETGGWAIDYVSFGYECPSLTISTSEALVKCGYVQLNWSEVDNADEYKVFRDGTEITSTTSTSYQDYDAPTNSVEYRIEAWDDYGCKTANPHYHDSHKDPFPSDAGNIDGPKYPCEGDNVTYSISSVDYADEYEWDIPSNWVGSSSSREITVDVGSSSGTVKVTPKNDCGDGDYSTKSVDPESKPSDAGSIDGPGSPCEGDNVTYSINSVSNADEYEWEIPGDWSGSSSSREISVTVGSNSGTVKVTPKNDCGDGDYSTKSVDPESEPSDAGSIDGPGSPCEGDNVTYSINSVSNADEYEW
ncbi:MAG: hypothetical protein R6V04_16170, partial [bacterium]